MPIYEFACPRCRVIFNFLSPRINPGRLPKCPKCGNKKLAKQMSTFASPSGKAAADSDSSPDGDTGGEMAGPNFDDPRVQRAMGELERDMSHLDENNPRHMAHMMRKMKDLMPSGALPKDLDIAIKRLESGEDPEKIEADMGDVLGDFMSGGESEDGDGGPAGGGSSSYRHDAGLYDY